MMVTLLHYLFLIILFVARVHPSEYKIVCYYNYWSNYYSSDGKFQVENIDPSLCTHLVYAYVDINSCYDVKILDPQLQGNENYRGRQDFKRFIELKRKNPDLKCLVAFGGYNGNHDSFSKMIKSSKSRDTFIRNVINFMDAYCVDKYLCFDGVSLDYYYPIANQANYRKEDFIQLLEEMKKMFKDKHKMIAVAASALGTNIKDYYDIPEIVELVDFVSLVTYDYHGPTWSNDKTGMVAPLYERTLPNGQKDILNQKATVYTWLNSVGWKDIDSTKLLLSVPTYGRSFKLTNKSLTKVGDPTTGAANIGPYTTTPGYFTYHELVNDIFMNDGTWTKDWHPKQEVPYAYKDNYWISYENEASVEKKAEFIKYMKLGGAMINSIDSDDFKPGRFPLIRKIKDVLLGPPPATITSPASTTTSTVPSDFTCTKEGHFTNIYNCNEYYVCDINLLQYKLSCPETLGFDESVCQCNYREFVTACNHISNQWTNGCIPKTEKVSNSEKRTFKLVRKILAGRH